MKKSHKDILKSIFITSLAALGTTPLQASVSRPMVIIGRNEDRLDNENLPLSERLSTGVLTSYTDSLEVDAHTSHSSHKSHSSHRSHTSHTSSSGYDGENGSTFNGKALGATLGIVGGGVALYYIVKAICNSSNKHNEYVNTPIIKEYGSRDLHGGLIGTDVDELIDSLRANGLLTNADLVQSKNPRYKKYNSSVKRAVKRMHVRMGRPKSKIASKQFLTDLKSWKVKRERYASLIKADILNLEHCEEALKAVAILLVEKGYLNKFDASNIMSSKEKKRIIDAYHKFQRENGLKESNFIDYHILTILYKLPTVS